MMRLVNNLKYLLFESTHDSKHSEVNNYMQYLVSFNIFYIHMKYSNTNIIQIPENIIIVNKKINPLLFCMVLI